MTKRNKFLHTVPMKFYLLLAAIMIFAFFSNDFGLVDIQKTAIILAAGVDKKENGYTLTAQIAVPKSADRNTGGTSSVNVIGEGKTVSDCVAEIYGKTGWVPKFVFCNLIVIGEDTVKDQAACSLDYFLRNEYLSDSCLVCTCEGSAQELLSAVSAIDDTSALAVGKLFSDAAKKSGQVESNTLRRFTISSYNQSKSGYMPFIRRKKQETESSASKTPSASRSGEEKEEVVFDASQTALFSESKMVALLSKEETNTFSLLRGDTLSGTITAKEGDTAVALTIVKNKGSVSLDMRGAPKVKLSVELRVRVYNYCHPAPIETIAETVPSETVLKNLTEKVEASVLSLWEKAAGSGCDLFELKRDLYRSSKRKYGEWKDTLLSALTPEIHVTVKAEK